MGLDRHLGFGLLMGVVCEPHNGRVTHLGSAELMLPSLEWIVHPEISAVNHERNLRMGRLLYPFPFPLPLREDQALGAWPSEAALFLAWHMFR